MKKVIPIAIPTLGRYDDIPTIRNLHLKKSDVTLFVNTKLEKVKYQKHFNKCEIIVTDTRGISKARNAILKHYDGNNVIMCDDDVKGLYRLNTMGKSRKEKEVKLDSRDEIFDFIKYGFKIMEKYGTKLWGVYPIKNHFFMSKRIVPAGFIIGTFCGVKADYKNIKFDTEMKLKEDYDFTLQHILTYKKIIRFNDVCVDAAHYTNKGGCQKYRDREKEMDACEILIDRYPQWVKLNSKREGEVLLKFKFEK